MVRAELIRIGECMDGWINGVHSFGSAALLGLVMWMMMMTWQREDHYQLRFQPSEHTDIVVFGSFCTARLFDGQGGSKWVGIYVDTLSDLVLLLKYISEVNGRFNQLIYSSGE